MIDDERTPPATAGSQLGSKPEAIARRASARAERKGLVIVNTGDGKGKTTAALGIVLRAWGRDLRVGGVQFFKHENANFGELRALHWRPLPNGLRKAAHSVTRPVLKAAHMGWVAA